MFSLCRHKYEKKIDDKGYQYCEACGHARYVPTKAKKCDHNWKIIKVLEKTILDNRVCDVIHILQCTKCGEMKNHKLTK